MLGSYPIVSEISLKLLMPFPSTYLCEAVFSRTLVSKQRLEIDLMLNQIYAAA